MHYVLQYDGFHNLQSIHAGLNSTPLVAYTHKENNGRLKQVTYRNGDNMQMTYNSMGQMIAEKWYDADSQLTAHYRYVYDGDGNIVRSIDILAGKEYTYTYEQGRLQRATECDVTLNGEIVTAKALVNTVRYVYNSEGTLTKKLIMPVGGNAQTVYYEKASDESTVAKQKIGEGCLTSHSKTDAFGRKVFDEIQTGTGFVSRQFAYYAGQMTAEHRDHAKVKSTAITQLISQIVLSDGRTLTYEYDAEERITKVIDSFEGTTEYTYDALGQLLTESRNGTVINEMAYDNYGNILTKNGIGYTYEFYPWKDLLLHVGDQDIEYDEQGNPTAYLGHTLTWEKGRQLKSFDGITYTYNANGIRTSKTVNGVKHTYTLEGTKILREVWGSNELIPLYDNEDAVCGILYNHVPFYFLKNLQGDIIAITNTNGETVARYSYDAWGACTILSDTSTCDIATINPYRYREYYYDEEIAMYYLQSRYYDSVVGRFLNSDNAEILALDPEVLAENLYAYCYNCPVNESDYNGALIGKVLKKIFVGVLKGFVKQFCIDLIEWAFIRFIRRIKKSFALSSAEDYISTILSEILDQFSLSQIVGLAASIVCLLIKYIPKLLGGRMKNKDWANLVVDITAIVVSNILGKISKDLKNKRSQLISKSFKTEWSKIYTSSLKQVRIKIKRYGFVLDYTIPISQQLVGSAINIIFAD